MHKGACKISYTSNKKKIKQKNFNKNNQSKKSIFKNNLKKKKHKHWSNQKIKFKKNII